MSVEEEKVDSNPEQTPHDHEVLETEMEQDVQSADSEGTEATPEGDKDWQKEALLLQEEISGLKDQALRATADAQNIRRRAEKDVEKAHKFALEKFSKELLPVVDSLEKTIESSQSGEGEKSALVEGVEMTLSILMASLKKFSVEPVDPVGEPFDPALHEAMSMVDAPDAEPNSVIAVIQKGYTLNGRLIRPAMVMVAKGSAKIDEKA
ncbi:nucleotide exchange factor GrpE [Alkalimarinus sediminis]|uniref:Protein GrpE n=1 Tax=Alkalimarinus sediminis TaxID=1632866 RepID=A0A9E8HGG8_9ALTE|nr:nucleotide exchange factor GrpE [Alkalimarinus sediminis]UZW74220.1 nucleotide exchange factor GrpE [Alkalimarinus sediminis]